MRNLPIVSLFAIGAQSVFSRTIRSFSDRAQNLAGYQKFLDDPNTRFSTIGIGTSLRL